MEGAMQTFKARYVRKGLNPFAVGAWTASHRNFCYIEAKLSKKQVAEKDRFAKAATPKGYEFVECVPV